MKVWIIYQTILLYCLQCRKNTESKNPRVANTNKGKSMLLSKYSVCGSKKLRFITEQEGSGLTGLLGTKSPFEGIPI